MRTVKAKLPEPQTRALKPRMAYLMVNVLFGAGDRQNATVDLDGSVIMIVSRLHPDRATRPPSEGYGRTGRLTAPHLLCRVNAGSPQRAALHGPAGRRSRHSSRRPGVTPGTAAGSRTAVAEPDRATGRGTPAGRVKGGASAGIGSSRPAQEGALMRPEAGEERPNPLRSEGGCRSRMMRKYHVRFRGRGRGDV